MRPHIRFSDDCKYCPRLMQRRLVCKRMARGNEADAPSAAHAACGILLRQQRRSSPQASSSALLQRSDSNKQDCHGCAP